MKHIAIAVIAAAVLAVVGPRISQGHPKEAMAAPQELFAPSDYRAIPSGRQAEPEFPRLHFKR
jgi:hypothetical protein